MTTPITTRAALETALRHLAGAPTPERDRLAAIARISQVLDQRSGELVGGEPFEPGVDTLPEAIDVWIDG